MSEISSSVSNTVNADIAPKQIQITTFEYEIRGKKLYFGDKSLEEIVGINKQDNIPEKDRMDPVAIKQLLLMQDALTGNRASSVCLSSPDDLYIYQKAGNKVRLVSLRMPAEMQVEVLKGLGIKVSMIEGNNQVPFEAVLNTPDSQKLDFNKIPQIFFNLTGDRHEFQDSYIVNDKIFEDEVINIRNNSPDNKINEQLTRIKLQHPVSDLQSLIETSVRPEYNQSSINQITNNDDILRQYVNSRLATEEKAQDLSKQALQNYHYKKQTELRDGISFASDRTSEEKATIRSQIPVSKQEPYFRKIAPGNEIAPGKSHLIKTDRVVANKPRSGKKIILRNQSKSFHKPVDKRATLNPQEYKKNIQAKNDSTEVIFKKITHRVLANRISENKNNYILRAPALSNKKPVSIKTTENSLGFSEPVKAESGVLKPKASEAKMGAIYRSIRSEPTRVVLNKKQRRSDQDFSGIFDLRNARSVRASPRNIAGKIKVSISTLFLKIKHNITKTKEKLTFSKKYQKLSGVMKTRFKVASQLIFSKVKKIFSNFRKRIVNLPLIKRLANDRLASRFQSSFRVFGRLFNSLKLNVVRKFRMISKNSSLLKFRNTQFAKITKQIRLTNKIRRRPSYVLSIFRKRFSRKYLSRRRKARQLLLLRRKEISAQELVWQLMRKNEKRKLKRKKKSHFYS